jgi:hypothetical protein
VGHRGKVRRKGKLWSFLSVGIAQALKKFVQNAALSQASSQQLVYLVWERINVKISRYLTYH